MPHTSVEITKAVMCLVKCLDSFISDRKWAGLLAEALNSRFTSEEKTANQMLTVPANVFAILVKVNLKIQNSA